jgi:cell division protein FtsW (lipid II flippase)
VCCDFECLFWCAGWLAVGCCHPKFWFGLVLVVYFALLLLLVLLLGFPLGGLQLQGKQTRRLENRREERNVVHS